VPGRPGTLGGIVLSSEVAGRNTARSSRPGGSRLPRLRHLPVPLLAMAGLLIVGAAVAAPLQGAVGVAGVAAGVGLVAVSYVLSSLAIAWADRVNPRLVLPVGLTVYVVKFLFLGMFMLALNATGWLGLAPMGLAIVAAALTWSAAQAAWTWHAKIPYVEPAVEPSAAPTTNR
jgi:ATP synthase protein I